MHLAGNPRNIGCSSDAPAWSAKGGAVNPALPGTTLAWHNPPLNRNMIAEPAPTRVGAGSELMALRLRLWSAGGRPVAVGDIELRRAGQRRQQRHAAGLRRCGG